MNKKVVYYVGCVVLFLGLFWMMLPHVAHGAAVEAVGGEHEESHYRDVFNGLIGVLIGLGLIMYVNGDFDRWKK